MNARLARIVAWLRAGYPAGLPDGDYVPLLTLLRRRLTEEEVLEVAQDLRAHGVIPADTIDIGVGVTKVTQELPSEADVERVAARLRASGWPTAPWDGMSGAGEPHPS